ncbi:hypothetical protein Lal_00011623 [Lupinus albus]|uniref:Uncharacterized protein n=1 Tax=Lupinus albus TaxID=3870 RepID=A0A6A5N0B2_LUPAL|nr:hypothetical protein Lalb_Chr06g0161561 [Lupinus albus]KAF1880564.1 hypothetical protein Lal_00011623 [Lupinus albus]
MLIVRGSGRKIVTGRSNSRWNFFWWLHHQGHHPHTTHHHQTLPRQGSSVHSSVRDVFHLTTGTLQNCDHTIPSEEDEPSLDGFDGHHESGRGKKGLP